MGLGLAWAAQGTKSTDLVSHVDWKNQVDS
jgi:hypothetical protein